MKKSNARDQAPPGRKLSLWIGSSLGTLLVAAANISPEQAGSNLSGWLRWLRLDWLATRMSPPFVDFLVAAVGSALILVAVINLVQSLIANQRPKSRIAAPKLTKPVLGALVLPYGVAVVAISIPVGWIAWHLQSSKPISIDDPVDSSVVQRTIDSTESGPESVQPNSGANPQQIQTSNAMVHKMPKPPIPRLAPTQEVTSASIEADGAVQEQMPPQKNDRVEVPTAAEVTQERPVQGLTWFQFTGVKSVNFDKVIVHGGRLIEATNVGTLSAPDVEITGNDNGGRSVAFDLKDVGSANLSGAKIKNYNTGVRAEGVQILDLSNANAELASSPDEVERP